ncbi:hypothetical protein ACFW08_05715 [Streptomyces sp. NPDC058960]|uniref:hypothetical protein n=1 Tax=Streptomyces sp. NPDC058960 TaxID=3346679 RepID=UPI0036AC803D
MSALHAIDAAMSPALGDIRAAGEGDLIYIRPEATTRRDFPKIWEAVGVALARGAFVCVMNREES